ncbi:MAG: hypothetical protein DRH70_02090 [Candidatus Coatesbacteria bacterium]|nr:MAG: hypothetical protein DRH70_02090 [Candidatus Coatesbacteria bacterium]HDM59590.1 DUF507 family protein [Bacillota bacterium]
MRLSDDKISDIAFKLTDRLKEDERVRFVASENVVRAAIRRTITSELKLEDEVIQIVLGKLDAMKSVKRDTPKWEAHFERLYAAEMAKRGRQWDINVRDVFR